MGFLAWLEASGFSEWVRVSYVGYPLMIASHAVGMAVMVGLALAIDMRLLGWFAGIPRQAFDRFFTLAWIGFAVNFLSGSGLFAARATTYITDGTFLLKMAFVLGGVITAALLQGAIKRSPDWPSATAPAGVRIVAVASIVCWVFATITGRLIAYL
ncbi:MAG TPA: DUF6644 family protein [Gammaproteobacteria bacterium]|nr:DUF6644 family protein [Gammaproteobacteria bacterium]